MAALPRQLALNEKQLRSVSFPKPSVAVSLPDTPNRAYVWEYQDEDDVFVRDHRGAKSNREYQALRRHSLDSWMPVCKTFAHVNGSTIVSVTTRNTKE